MFVQSKILILGKSYIDTPEKWTQRLYARDTKGHGAAVMSDNAVCFCSIGALYKANRVMKHYNSESATQYLQTAIDGKHPGALMQFNDSHTHEQVMQAWDKAINLALEYESD